jgi:hypothetical protein
LLHQAHWFVETKVRRLVGQRSEEGSMLAAMAQREAKRPWNQTSRPAREC